LFEIDLFQVGSRLIYPYVLLDFFISRQKEAVLSITLTFHTMEHGKHRGHAYTPSNLTHFHESPSASSHLHSSPWHQYPLKPLSN
jgi:hypothetical protein